MSDDERDNAALVANLRQFALSESTKARPRLRCNNFRLPDSQFVSSWKFWEWAYLKPDPLPTLARGLFTIRDQIVIRGYDKFFATGECEATSWQSLESNTVGPYTLTFKENGCIIFIAAVNETELIVSSKHSLGVPSSAEVNFQEDSSEEVKPEQQRIIHAEQSDTNQTAQDTTRDERAHANVGRQWLLKHLASAGKTEQELAAVLYRKRVTVVAELCDDSFEEHVLEYSRSRSGLHLHGLNRNVSFLDTAPFEEVELFAKEWGFRVTNYDIVQDITQLKELLNKAEKDGHYKDQVLEGFVIRCLRNEPMQTQDNSSNLRPFFFKFKFTEPYKMYREWREITRSVLKASQPNCSSKQDQTTRRATYPQSAVLLEWLKKDIVTNSELYSQFESHSIGILASRNRFLEYLKSSEGVDRLNSVILHWGKKKNGKKQPLLEENAHTPKTIIYPIGVPGCGKTSLFLALSRLLPRCEHIQSDDFGSKEFIMKIKKAQTRDDLDLIIADKNNHLTGHRQALKSLMPANLIIFNFINDELPDLSLLRICSDRILQRGENHQTLRAETEFDHKAVIWRFLSKLDRLSSEERSEVSDKCLNMDVQLDQKEMLNSAITFLFPILNLPLPTEEQVEEALHWTTKYKPSVRKKLSSEPEQVVRYFGIATEINIKGLLNQLPLSLRDVIPSECLMKKPHLTLVHNSEQDKETHKMFWQLCQDYTRSEDNQNFWKVRLGEVLYDGRVMAVSVEIITPPGTHSEIEESVAANVSAYCDRSSHITLGTSDPSIRGFEALEMTRKWNKMQSKAEKEASGIISHSLDGLEVKGRLEGMH